MALNSGNDPLAPRVEAHRERRRCVGGWNRELDHASEAAPEAGEISETGEERPSAHLRTASGYERGGEVQVGPENAVVGRDPLELVDNEEASDIQLGRPRRGDGDRVLQVGEEETGVDEVGRASRKVPARPRPR